MKDWLFVFAAIIFLSACNDASDNNLNEGSGMVSERESEHEDDSLVKELESEEEELENKLKELRTRADQQGKEIGREVDQSLDSLETKIKGFDFERRADEVEKDWKAFKQETEEYLDSLEEKI